MHTLLYIKVPGTGPILISNAVLETLAKGISYDKRALELRHGGPAPLTKAPSGHLLIDLTPPPKEKWYERENPIICTDEITVWNSLYLGLEELRKADKLGPRANSKHECLACVQGKLP